MKTLKKKNIKKTIRKIYTNKVKETVNEFIRNLADNCDLGRSQNSCGVRDLDEVNEEFENSLLTNDDFDNSLLTNDDFDNSLNFDAVENIERKSKLTSIEYVKFKEYLIANFSKLLKKELNFNSRKPWAFYNISLNHLANKDLIEILDKSTPFQTDWRTNPNSDNKIKIWLL